MPDDSSPSTWFEEWKDGGFVLNEDDISDFLADLPGSETTIEDPRKRGASLSITSEQPSTKRVATSPSEVFMLFSKQWGPRRKPDVKAHGAFSSLEKAELQVPKLRKDFFILDDDLITHKSSSASEPYYFEYEDGDGKTKIWVESFMIDGPAESGRDLSTTWF